MPVMCLVRKRDIVTHQSRLDMESYQQHINRPTSHHQGPYFVIGTDIAASTVARILHDNGLDFYIVKTDANEPHARLVAEESSVFPNWMEDRVASICEHHQTNTLDDVSRLLRKNIKVVDEVSDEGLVVFQPPETSTEAEGLPSYLEQSVWQAVGILWSLNSAVKPKSISLQTKLI